MELYASGFNAHGQLLPAHSPHDLLAFRRIASGTSTIRVRCATWSATVLEIDGVLELRGYLPGEGRDEADERGGKSKVAVLRGLPADGIKTIVGDASGVLGALTTEGEIWVLDGRGGRDDREVGGPNGSTARSLSWVRHDLDLGALQASAGFPAREGGEMVIDQIAVAGNDRVCTSAHTRKPLPSKPARCELSCLHSLKKKPPTVHSSSPPSTLFTFPSLSSLLSSSPTLLSTATLPTSPTSLLGSSTTFQALCDSVPYTWGDARYAHLGRHPGLDCPADLPFPATLPALADDGREPQVQKIAAGGWLAAALTEGDCYVWGGRLGERERSIGQSEWGGDGEEELHRFVDVEGGRADVVDVAVGGGSVLVLTKTGKVWGWGDGRWGQLGTKGDKSGWVQGWVEVGGWEDEGKEVVGVECGVWNSFVIIKRKV